LKNAAPPSRNLPPHAGIILKNPVDFQGDQQACNPENEINSFTGTQEPGTPGLIPLKIASIDKGS